MLLCALVFDYFALTGSILFGACLVLTPEEPRRLTAKFAYSHPPHLSSLLAANKVLVARP